MGPNTSSFFAFVTSTAALTGAALPVLAQSGQQLPETVVARVANPIEEVASAVTVITAQDMLERAYGVTGEVEHWNGEFFVIP